MDKGLGELMSVLVGRSFVQARELEKETHATKRQLSYRIAKINELLEAYQAPQILLTYQKEIVIEKKTREAMLALLGDEVKDNAYYFQKEERLAVIYLIVFLKLDYTSLNDFMDCLRVSRSTVLADLKELQAELERASITLCNNRREGYYLEGNEMELRRYMMSVIIDTIAMQGSRQVFDSVIEQYHLDRFAEVRAQIEKLSMQHKIRFVEDRLSEFIYILILLKARMLSLHRTGQKDVEPVVQVEMKEMKEYCFTCSLLSKSIRQELLDEADIRYISAWILGISIGNLKEETTDKELICNLVSRILIRFESLSGFHYRDYEDIFAQLYSHFRPAYYRLLFHLPIYNPLKSRIHKEYHELYRLVEETMKPFSSLFEGHMPEDEIAYLTVHFASIFSKEREGIVLQKKRAMIVCSNGIGTSAILYSELSSLFPEFDFLAPTATKEATKDLKADIIFTTIPVSKEEWRDIPVIQVHPVMTSLEKYQLSREVHYQLKETYPAQPKIEEIMSIVMKYAQECDEDEIRRQLAACLYQSEFHPQKKERGISLKDITDGRLVSLNIEASTIEEAVRGAAEPLVRYGYAKPSYVDEMVRIAKTSGAYLVITKHVALPHARVEAGALRIGISIATLKQDVIFHHPENDPVRYVFCLSATDNESHITAMAELMELLEKDAFYQVLRQAKDAQDVMSFITEHTAIGG